MKLFYFPGACRLAPHINTCTYEVLRPAAISLAGVLRQQLARTARWSWAK